MTVVIALVVGFVAVRFLIVAAHQVIAAPALQRVNYRGRAIPVVGGVLIVAAALIVEAGRATLGAVGLGDEPGLNLARPLVLLVCFGFGMLGLMDDVLGTGEDRGFRGHLRALSQGRVTTGLLKLVGGAGIAIVVAAEPGFITGKRVIADALLIALAANLGNLFDRAPGRTIKVALVTYVPVAVALGTGAVGIAVAPVMGAALGVLPEDLREHLMLGDTGANVLGAVLGVAVVLDTSRATRNVVIVALIVLNLAAEFVSFSRLIDRVPPLRWFDRLGGRARPTAAAHGDGTES
jgi:UDP-N-acetylmuramyl pentapeptide phosphotransferase/UDP-N-acetylglucosamine-1-phosphate transferase